MVDWNERFEVLKDAIVTFFLCIYLYIEGIIFAILPSDFRAKDVSGEVVLVTGAGSGIGRLIALHFAKLGCRLVLWDINKKSIENVADEAKRYGVKTYTYAIDLSFREDVYKVAEQVKKEAGPVDILVNNAGIVTGKKFMDCPDALIQKTMEVNVMSHFWTVKAFLPAMIAQNHGHIVTIASSAGLMGANGLCDYCASKFAAVGFDESLRFELLANGKTGIHTTVVCPYYINTGMFDGAQTRFPLALPVLKPEYVAKKVVAAILCNQEMLCTPLMMYFAFIVRAVVPSKVHYQLMRFSGANNLMDKFVGRQQKQD